VLVGALGLAVAAADLELANLQRKQILEEIGPKVPRLRLPLYYVGEHGDAYYFDRIGLAPLPKEPEQLPSRYAVIEVATGHPGWGIPQMRRSDPWSSQAVGRLPMNTLSYGVSFYVTGNQNLPWDVGKSSELFFNIYTAGAVSDMAPPGTE
jgi:hypothetical protein